VTIISSLKKLQEQVNYLMWKDKASISSEAIKINPHSNLLEGNGLKRY